MQIAQGGQDLQHVADGLGDRQLLTLGRPQRGSADVLHHDVADGAAVPVFVFDEVVDLHDARMGHLGEEPSLEHRNLLGLGIAGVDQALEHDGSFVHVVVERQVHPPESAVRDAALDLVLFGDPVARTQLRQKGIRAAAMWAPTLRQRLAVVGGPADRAAAVPAEPLRLGDHRIGHQRFKRILRTHAGDFHQAATEAARPRQRPGRGRVLVLRFGVACADGHALRVVVEVRTVHRLGGHRAQRCDAVGIHVVDTGRLGSRPGLVEVLRMHLDHQPEYLATGGAGAGPSTVNHLRYKVFHVPSRRMRSSVPLTKRTSPVFCRLMPIP